MSLPAVAAAGDGEGGAPWPVKSPVTDSAAGQIQAAYRRKREESHKRRGMVADGGKQSLKPLWGYEKTALKTDASTKDEPKLLNPRMS